MHHPKGLAPIPRTTFISAPRLTNKWDNSQGSSIVNENNLTFRVNNGQPKYRCKSKMIQYIVTYCCASQFAQESPEVSCPCLFHKFQGVDHDIPPHRRCFCP